ncbi:flavin reductase family protein [Pseudoprimorskyibacter insulae]|uniref:FMN reductase (NADH) NtaB n=1 Tax=Pseudoprimorskyibacter insulae TaxID=1695997 RepID=A0A2R8AQQ1_9RHOB|nr:flavin reductase family protein [Pseudoprimorskyibacter insulae]SPF78169.1 FMN reductase (NADH) NtaB [Pseudoprimorskyibacter insulae]
MSVSLNDFKRAMRALPAQVAVISAKADDVRIAMTATAVTSLSAEPPQLLICVHHMARPAAVIRKAGAFAVNLVHCQQVDVATQCALPGLEPEDRFALGQWTDGEGAGQPLLDGAVVNFDCRLVSEAQHGTHFVFVGQIEALRFADGAPLLYHDAGYRELGNRLDALHLNWDNSGLAF